MFRKLSIHFLVLNQGQKTMSITQINYMSPGIIDVTDSVGNKTRTQFANAGQITSITTFTGSQPNRSVVSTAGFGSGLALVASITTTQFTLAPATIDASDRFIGNRSTGALLFDRHGNRLNRFRINYHLKQQTYVSKCQHYGNCVVIKSDRSSDLKHQD